MIDQEKIHKQCLSKNLKERIKALNQLICNFSSLVDKQQAWNDLLILTTDENSSMRETAVEALGDAFTYMPDKQKAWNDLTKLTNDEDYFVKEKAITILRIRRLANYLFSNVSDQQQAWNDLTKLTNDEDSYMKLWADLARVATITSIIIDEDRMRETITSDLCSVFSDEPDKQQLWDDLVRLISDPATYKDRHLRDTAVFALQILFSDVPDKQQAWSDLIKLTSDEKIYVRRIAVSALGSVFPHAPDEEQAWNDLIKLIIDEDSFVRETATSALGNAFSHMRDKQQAWNDLLKLTTDEDSSVKETATSALGNAFTYVPDKQKAWNDLIKLTSSQDSTVRSKAASALHSTFSDVPDKQQAWNDLIKLIGNEDSSVREMAASALRSTFSDVPDKQQAWNDLIKLTSDKKIYVRRIAVSTLRSVFTYMPDGRCLSEILYEHHTFSHLIEKFKRKISKDKLPEEKSVLVDKSEGQEYKNEDCVNFTLTAPPLILPGNNYVICVWAYLSEQEQKMLEEAKKFHDTKNLIEKSKKSVSIQRKTTITVILDIPEFNTKTVDTIYWDGNIANASFGVSIPANISSNWYNGKVGLFVENVEIAKLDFMLSVGTECQTLNTFVNRTLINSAFASYSDDDRNEVLARIQGIKKINPYINIFMDIVSLHSGEDWYKRLKEEIIKRDIFYLFWSEAASKSKCVNKEWKIALYSKGIEFISPVPLVSPDKVPPPPELESLHFNDWTLEVMKHTS